MRFMVLCVAVWVSIMSCPAFGAEGYRLDHDCTLFVEQGDSYIKLFGPDWLRVFHANSEMVFYNSQGRLAHNPEKLVTGTRLVVPKGTRLTDVAMRRLSRYNRMKAAAMEEIRKAKAFVNKPSERGSEVYQQGIKLLLRANAAAQGLSYGFENYLDARCLAEEAIRCFEIDADLRKANNDAALLFREQAQRETIAVKNGIQGVYLRRVFPLGLGMLLLLGLVWRMRRRSRKDRIDRIKGWLARHEEELKRLDRVLA